MPVDESYAIKMALGFYGNQTNLQISDFNTKATEDIKMGKVNKRIYRVNYLDSTNMHQYQFKIPVYFVSFIKDNDEGLAIVSGDLRIPIVIAFIENTTLADTLANYGLASTLKAIPNICENQLRSFYKQRQENRILDSTINYTAKNVVYKARNIEDGWAIVRLYVPGNVEVAMYPQVLTTTWNQTYPYNKSLDPIDGQLPPTGCGAVAAAQICAMCKLPTEYNWSLLTSTPAITLLSPIEAQNQVAKLMRQIGIKADIQYDLGGSWTTLEKVRSALNSFGVSTGKVVSYNDFTIMGDMAHYRYILRGTGPDGGHEWIPDGGKQSIGTYTVQEYAKKLEGDLSLDDPNQLTESQWEDIEENPIYDNGSFKTAPYINYFWCNWGWGGDYDGYYLSNAFNPHNISLNKDNQMLKINFRVGGSIL